MRGNSHSLSIWNSSLKFSWYLTSGHHAFYPLVLFWTCSSSFSNGFLRSFIRQINNWLHVRTCAGRHCQNRRGSKCAEDSCHASTSALEARLPPGRRGGGGERASSEDQWHGEVESGGSKLGVTDIIGVGLKAKIGYLLPVNCFELSRIDLILVFERTAYCSRFTTILKNRKKLG